MLVCVTLESSTVPVQTGLARHNSKGKNYAMTNCNINYIHNICTEHLELKVRSKYTVLHFSQNVVSQERYV
jgi:hypothetical protein